MSLQSCPVLQIIMTAILSALTISAAPTFSLLAADIVVLTVAPTKLRRVAVFSVEPEVGPLTGGTEVTLEVST